MKEHQSFNAHYSKAMINMSEDQTSTPSVRLLMAPKDDKTSYRRLKWFSGLQVVVILITLGLTIIILSSNKNPIETLTEKNNLTHVMIPSFDDFITIAQSTDNGNYHL